MVRLRRQLCAAAWSAAALLAGTFSASAQVVNVSNLDFDGNNNFYSYSYAYAGGGNPQTDRPGGVQNPAVTTTNPGRVGNGLQMNADFTPLAALPPFPDYNYHGFGGGFGGQFTPFISQYLFDARFGVDLASSGFGGAIPTEIKIELQVQDDSITPDANTDGDPFLTIIFNTQTGAAFSRFEADLSSGNLVYDAARVPAAEQDFEKHFAKVSFINYNFNFEASNGASGQDANNVVTFDNLLLTQVPEPVSAAMVLPLAALLVGRRRR